MKSAQTRKDIREEVFKRDNYKCVFCGGEPEDAHHIIERKLWRPDDGYLMDNLVSVCEECHKRCETGFYTPRDCREAANITEVVVPDSMYPDQEYDKWGNPEVGMFVFSRGPLFDDPSFQRLLKSGGLVGTYTKRVKYPRTHHLPWSSPEKDDKRLTSTKHFEGREVVITEKLDGENLTLYNDYVHARSTDGPTHSDHWWIKAFRYCFAHEVPENYRICGEYLFSQRSIKYEDLPTYFFGFSVWDGLTCLSWDDTMEWFDLLNIEPVPVIYRGKWREDQTKKLAQTMDLDKKEGYVVRLADSFEYKDFQRSVAKFVRPDHLKTDERWKRVKQQNGLMEGTRDALRVVR